jgi:Cof subfamily protein (haloacid dehalogenase superfamily)
MTMIRLFVSDLDHTLLNDSKEIEPTDLAALQQLQEAGVNLAIASGRTDPEIQQVLSSLTLPYHRISQNGTFVRTHQGEILHSSTFPAETAKQILRLSSSNSLLTFITIGEITYTPHLSAEARDYIKRMELPNIYEKKGVMEQLTDEKPPCKIAFIGDMDEILALQQTLKQQPSIHQKTDSFISSPYCMDIVPKHISKGYGLQCLMKKLGLQPNEIATIGDSYNDIPMLELTKNSFAMAHAEPQVQEKAKYVVDSVAKAVERVLEANKQTC